MSSTPKPPMTDGSPTDPTGTPQTSLDHTLLGVAPAPRIPEAASNPSEPAPNRDPRRVIPQAPDAARPRPAPAAIGVAPMIEIASGKPVPHGGAVQATPAGAMRSSASAPPEPVPPSPLAAVQQTFVYATPRASTAPAPWSPTTGAGAPPTTPAATPASASRSTFPKPQAYAMPPRAGDASRVFDNGDRTALTADYLRAAREAALGGSALDAGERTRPTHPRVAPASSPPQGRTASPPQVSATQPSLGFEHASARTPRALAGSVTTDVATRSSEGEAGRAFPPPPALPPLPAVSPSVDPSHDLPELPGFEPVPQPRMHLSDPTGPSLGGGRSLGHISVDWNPEFSEQARKAAGGAVNGPQRQRRRVLVLATLGLVLLTAFGFLAARSPVSKWLARMMRPETSAEAPAPASRPATPERTTFANRPSTSNAAEDEGAAGNAVPPEPN